MSLGKRQHEIWTEGGSGRVNKTDTIKEDRLNIKYTKQDQKLKRQKLLIATLLVTRHRGKILTAVGKVSEGKMQQACSC